MECWCMYIVPNVSQLKRSNLYENRFKTIAAVKQYSMGALASSFQPFLPSK